MVQLESPTVFAVEMDGLINFFRGGRGTLYRRSCGVDGDNKGCGGFCVSVLVRGNRDSKVTVESAAK